ncbi:MAG: YibE/F family protein [Eubacteriales bacterium]
MRTKQNKKKSATVLYVLIVVISLLFIVLGYNLNKATVDVAQEEFAKAKVTKILSVKNHELPPVENEEPIVNKEIKAKAVFTGGSQKGSEIKILQYIDNMYGVSHRQIEEGDKIILTYGQNPNGKGQTWMFVNYDRIGGIIKLTLFFLALIVLFSMKKGVSTVISLCFTAAVIFLVYIPSILAGRNIYISTIIISVYIVVMSLALMNGVNKKTLCAILGNLGGLFLSGLLAVIVAKNFRITGFVDENYIFLLYIFSEKPLDLRAIIWGGVVIGSLGAIMDVSMSIASAMKELADAMKGKPISKLIKSGMNIGRDAIGTMTNTLILAYIGGSLATVILLVATNKNLLFLFNMEMILVEILQSIVGSIGIIFAVPVTVVVSAYFYHIKNRDKTEKDVNKIEGDL